MKLKFLGTAAAEGWPALFCQCEVCRKARRSGGKNVRTRSSCLLDEECLIDFQSDTYLHALKYKLELGRLRHIVITHSHEDHFYPQALQLRKEPFAYLEEEEKLHLYGNRSVENKLEEVQSKWSERKGAPLEFHQIGPGESFKAGQTNFYPLRAAHMEGETALLYLMEKEGKRVLYGHDSGFFPEDTWRILAQVRLDCAILDCTFGKKKGQGGHMGVQMNLKVKERMLREGIADEETNFVLTHFSHNGGFLHQELQEAVAPHDFTVAYDGLEIEL